MERKRGKLQWDFPRNVTSMRLMTQLGADYGLAGKHLPCWYRR
jgi:hypothetical protein